MSVIATLTREHRLFERLIFRLRGAGELAPGPARLRVRQSLLVLLPALARHDEIEDAVFGRANQTDIDQSKARSLVAAQHDGIKRLRLEIGDLLDNEAQATPLRFKTLVESLCEELEWHFKTEEMLLWPLCGHGASRSIAQSLERKAERSVGDLDADVKKLEALVKGRLQSVP